MVISAGRARAIERDIKQNRATLRQKQLLQQFQAVQPSSIPPGKLITPKDLPSVPRGRTSFLTPGRMSALERRAFSGRASRPELQLLQAGKLGQRKNLIQEASKFFFVGSRALPTSEFTLKTRDGLKVLEAKPKEFKIFEKTKSGKDLRIQKETFIPTTLQFSKKGIITKEIRRDIFRSETKKFKGVKTIERDVFQKIILDFEKGKVAKAELRDVRTDYVRKKPGFKKIEKGIFLKEQFNFLTGTGSIFQPRRASRSIKRPGEINIPSSAFAIGRANALLSAGLSLKSRPLVSFKL